MTAALPATALQQAPRRSELAARVLVGHGLVWPCRAAAGQRPWPTSCSATSAAVQPPARGLYGTAMLLAAALLGPLAAGAAPAPEPAPGCWARRAAGRRGCTWFLTGLGRACPGADFTRCLPSCAQRRAVQRHGALTSLFAGRPHAGAAGCATPRNRAGLLARPGRRRRPRQPANVLLGQLLFTAVALMAALLLSAAAGRAAWARRKRQEQPLAELLRIGSDWQLGAGRPAAA
jgi:hypothetical protein